MQILYQTMPADTNEFDDWQSNYQSTALEIDGIIFTDTTVQVTKTWDEFKDLITGEGQFMWQNVCYQPGIEYPYIYLIANQ